ncbi:hypothetical protein [Streptomyces sp. NPDC058398]|uniref:hypothetical protein n=1 Tax=Streptomyces sp. NPDC058398 TaxID=3346479 RepID=UPI003646227D
MAHGDVPVTGVGVAGPALAHWLGRHGMRVTVVERAPAPREGAQTADLRGAGRDVARETGLEHTQRSMPPAKEASAWSTRRTAPKSPSPAAPSAARAPSWIRVRATHRASISAISLAAGRRFIGTDTGVQSRGGVLTAAGAGMRWVANFGDTGSEEKAEEFGQMMWRKISGSD